MTTIITHPQSKEYSLGWDRIFGKKSLTQLLQDLGETQEEVASTLRSLGHKGVTRSNLACPVSNYLKAHGVDRPITTLLSVTTCGFGEGGEEVDTPPPVCHFIFAFDCGNYPELIQPPVIETFIKAAKEAQANGIDTGLLGAMDQEDQT